MRELSSMLEASEKRVAQLVRAAESLPSVEAELAQRTAALSNAQAASGSAEERCVQLEAEFESRAQELARVCVTLLYCSVTANDESAPHSLMARRSSRSRAGRVEFYKNPIVFLMWLARAAD